MKLVRRVPSYTCRIFTGPPRVPPNVFRVYGCCVTGESGWSW